MRHSRDQLGRDVILLRFAVDNRAERNFLREERLPGLLSRASDLGDRLWRQCDFLCDLRGRASRSLRYRAHRALNSARNLISDLSCSLQVASDLIGRGGVLRYWIRCATRGSAFALRCRVGDF